MSGTGDRSGGLEIAIVGMSGRFPGATDLSRFWANLAAGVESVRVFTDDELAAAGVPAAVRRDPRYVPAQAVLDDIESFDASFFDLTPRDAALLDPQQRLLLECAWEALEQAGYAAGGAEPVGVYAGVGFPQYLVTNLLSSGVLEADGKRHAAIWNDKDHASTRIAYKLGLTGPAVTVQTACSTSLVAVHQAVQALLAGECDLALAGGVSLRLPKVAGYRYAEGGPESPDGHCRAFDARTSGLVPGSGGGVVALCRLDDALAADTEIFAVLRGSAVTNDGRAKVGYTAPGVEGQVRAIRAAHLVAGVSPDEITYVEAHGTGTTLGDPIEIAALSAAFGHSADRAPCHVGSVKTNIGHLDVGAGIAGLIKTVLALRHRQIPASLHFEVPNPNIDFATSPFAVPTTLLDWSAAAGPRLAGVSSFGIGGTNAHVVLEEAPAGTAPAACGDAEDHVLVLSARSASALAAASAALEDHLVSNRPVLADVAYTGQVGRRAFEHRKAWVARDVDAAVRALREDTSTHTTPGGTPTVAFLFPGQGVLRPGAGSAMYRTEQVFRDAVDECAEALCDAGGADVRDLLLAAPEDDVEERLARTADAQPALFTLEYALARQWRSWGVDAGVLLGHSVGEYVAACLAGILGPTDALLVVAQRGALLDELPPGAMLAVPLGESDLDLDRVGLDLAAVNGPRQCVVSGPAAAVEDFRRQLEKRRIPSRPIDATRAFHSRLTDPILPRFRAVIGAVNLARPHTRMLCNLSGGWLTDEEAVDPDRWVRQLREPVRFAAAVRTLVTPNPPVCLEISARPVLSRLVRRAAPAAVAVTALDETGDSRSARVALARLWGAGITPDWPALHRGRRPRRIPLPTYPFQRTRHWIEPTPTPTRSAREHGQSTEVTLVKREDPRAWSYLPYWRPLGPVGPASEDEPAWLVIRPAGPLPDAVADLLAASGSVLAMVRTGTDYGAVLARLPRRPDRVLYWAASTSQADIGSTAQDLFVDLMRLAQELAADPAPCRLDVVTTGAQAVVPGEPVELGQTPLLGIVRVLSQECPQISCRSLDLPLDLVDADAVVAELRQQVLPGATPLQTTVAMRNGGRWEPALASAELPPAVPGAGLREGGTYLLTGGLGSVGLTIAQYLARTCRANLVLTGRQPVPDPRSWPALIAAEDAAPAASSLASAAARIEALDRGAPARSARVRRVSDLMDRLSVQYVLKLFADGGVAPAGAPVAVEEMVARLRVVPTYTGFLRGLIAILEEDGLVDLADDVVTFHPWAASIGEPASTDRMIRSEYPEFVPVLDMLRCCVTAIPAVLSGERDPVEVLFPSGDSSDFDRVNRLIGEHSDQQHYLAVLHEAIAELARRTGRAVRVLEVGAGKGRLTELLVPTLDSLGAQYHVTDVSAGFVNKLRERFAAPGVSFGTLDISKDPLAQGHPAGEADLVVGFNVVHAAPDVLQAVGHLQTLIRPGGLLCLAEAVVDVRWGRLIWGLTREWWSFTDTGLRTQGPLLRIADWTRVLTDAGYAPVRALPAEEERRDGCDTALLFAERRPGAPEASRVQVLQALVEDGIKVIARSVDAADPIGMRALITEAEERFGPIRGVLHLAYVAGGTLLALRTPDEVSAELRPKIHGALVLDDLFKDRDLDFMLLFSSLSALVGGYGAAAYAGACSFVDRFPATVRRAYPVLAVNWPLWRGLDTAHATEHRRRTMPPGVDETGMTPAEGLDVLSRLLASRHTGRVVISPADVSVLLRLAGDWRPHDVATTGVGGPAEHRTHGDGTTGRVIAVWREVLGIEDLEPDTDFVSVGGDSLVATQIVARLRDTFGLELSLRDFFADPTVSGNARALDTASSGRLPRGEDAGLGGSGPDVAALLRKIEGMSDDEVRSELAAERTSPVGEAE